MKSKKGVMPLSELNNRLSDIMNFVVFTVYARPVDRKPGVTFDMENIEEEHERREKFKEEVRNLIERELKRFYDIIPG